MDNVVYITEELREHYKQRRRILDPLSYRNGKYLSPLESKDRVSKERKRKNTDILRSNRLPTGPRVDK